MPRFTLAGARADALSRQPGASRKKNRSGCARPESLKSRFLITVFTVDHSGHQGGILERQTRNVPLVALSLSCCREQFIPFEPSLFHAIASQLPHTLATPLFLHRLSRFDDSADFPAWTFEMMTTKRNRIRIEMYPSSDAAKSGIDRLPSADDATVRLARLIGRQMAREDFERKLARERKGPVMASKQDLS
ncbi:hypothetical protein [Agrobacterium cavarae]|uniref:hypothetical protein n=1 Tax=Agrobacterium cavarae TaxID=2528239 RepID=UPI00289E7B07|nr:hypothetical protein [Agrobacterium cavarae]